MGSGPNEHGKDACPSELIYSFLRAVLALLRLIVLIVLMVIMVIMDSPGTLALLLNPAENPTTNRQTQNPSYWIQMPVHLISCGRTCGKVYPPILFPFFPRGFVILSSPVWLLLLYNSCYYWL